MTINDENLFLDQIKSISDFIIVESFAKTSKELFIDIANKKHKNLGNHENFAEYYLWNKYLNWNPEFDITKTKDKLVYMKNELKAPFVQFCRQSVFPIPKGNVYGRLYVNTFHYENLPYDKNDLIDTYNKIVRIIKKTSAGKISDSWVTYFYPESWENYQNKIRNK